MVAEQIAGRGKRKESMKMMVMGLMSGTSADGIDVALARVEEARTHKTQRAQDQKIARARGAAVPQPHAVKRELVGHVTLPMDAAVRKEVLRIAEGGSCTAGEISQLNFRVGEEFAAAAIAACKKFGVQLEDVELIGSHGQTIFHQGMAVSFLRKKTASTLQIGEPTVIAARTGIPTVGDFRVADMAAGGQGAPLVPYVDWLLLRDEEIGRVALNLGGIGNVTVLQGEAKWRVGRAHPAQKARRGGHPRPPLCVPVLPTPSVLATTGPSSRGLWPVSHRRPSLGQ